MIKNHLLLFILILFQLGCQSKHPSQYEACKMIYPELAGVKIYLPDTFKYYNTNNKNYIKNNNLKIVKLFETQHIRSYNALIQWEEFHKKFHNHKGLDILLIFCGPETDYIKELREKGYLKIPIILDNESNLLYKNNLEKYSMGTFLLDSEDRILFYGDPTESKIVRKYYIQLIRKSKKQKKI